MDMWLAFQKVLSMYPLYAMSTENNVKTRYIPFLLLVTLQIKVRRQWRAILLYLHSPLKLYTFCLGRVNEERLCTIAEEVSTNGWNYVMSVSAEK